MKTDNFLKSLSSRSLRHCWKFFVALLFLFCLSIHAAAFKKPYASPRSFQPAVNILLPVSTTPAAGGTVFTTAVVLTNGTVLFIVGSGADVIVSEAFIFDPSSLSFTATGSPTTARVQATITPLGDGDILISGGLGNDGALASAELYSPSTGLFSPTGFLNIPRWSHSAVRLADGCVLINGGYNASGGLVSSEIYDPATKQWTITGSTVCPHLMGSLLLLADGSPLIVGGFNSGGPCGVCEIYSEASGRWRQTTSLNCPRAQQVAVLLTNHQVLVAGGNGYGNAGFLASAELFDPETEIWTLTGSMKVARFNPVGLVLPSGEALVAGGAGPISSSEIFDLPSQFWSEAVALTNASANAATILNNGEILVSGNFLNPDGSAAAIEILDPASLLPANAPVNGPTGEGTVTNTLAAAATPFSVNIASLPGGFIQITFTNTPGLTFEVLSSTNLSSSPATWPFRGMAIEVSPGCFQYTDFVGSDDQRYYYPIIKI